jgi:exosortase
MAFGTLVLLSAIVFWKTFGEWIAYSVHNESGSHLILIPLLSAFLLFMERHRIFSLARPAIITGISVTLMGVAFHWLAIRSTSLWQRDESLTVATLGIVLIWVGGFLSCYGLPAARAAAFPLIFLVLMVPLPEKVLDWTVHLLQEGSTDVAYFLFNAVGVPVLRNGFVLSVPGIAIEVARECSGIRSSIALFITCLLAAHLYLRTPWKIFAFILMVFPLAVVKNGIRIVTLTLLSIYVDPGFLYGNLHREGGFVFFLLALFLLFPVFVALERSERHRPDANTAQSANGIARAQKNKSGSILRYGSGDLR